MLFRARALELGQRTEHRSLVLQYTPQTILAKRLLSAHIRVTLGPALLSTEGPAS
jgi:hypothetical protein